MKMRKELWFGVAALLLVLPTAGAALVENFESYSTGSFVGQTGGAWTGSADWQVVDDGTGNNVLTLQYPAADLALMYAAEGFSAAGNGYRMQFTMLPEAGGYWASTYSGIVCDADAANPNSADCAHRFFTPDGGKFITVGGDAVAGSYSQGWSVTTYAMIDRVGDNVKVWLSTSPIDPSNPGTATIDAAAPALGNGGTAFGLYGVGSVYYDNISVAALPEPATMGLLIIGGLGVLVRRKCK